jgi:hypothetical protein
LVLLFLGIPGAVIAFGIIAGSLFLGLYLLVNIQANLSKIAKHLNVKEEEIAKISDGEIEKELEDDLVK